MNIRAILIQLFKKAKVKFFFNIDYFSKCLFMSRLPEYSHGLIVNKIKRTVMKALWFIILMLITSCSYADQFISMATHGYTKAIVITAPDIDSAPELIDQFLLWSCSTVCQVFEYALAHDYYCILIMPELENRFAPYSTQGRYTQALDCLKAISYAYQMARSLRLMVINPLSTQSITYAIAQLFSTESKTIVQSSTELIYQEQQEHSEQDINFEDIEISLSTHESLHITQKLSHMPCAVITGGAGFLGKKLAEELLEKGYHVIVLDNFICSDKTNLDCFKDHHALEWYEWDVTKPFTINGRVDVIIHAASVPSPKYFYALPVETYQSGAIATINTLELAREKNARYIFCSTAEVYGKAEITPQPEWYSGNNNALGMRAPYDQSKRGSEALCGLYAQKYTVDARIMRIFNTYGPGASLQDGRVITNFIDAVLHDKPLIISGNGQQTRSFNFITNTVEDMLLIMFDDELHGTVADKVFNIGSAEEITVSTLAAMVQELALTILAKDVTITYIPSIDRDEPMQRKPDLTKFIQRYGAKNKISTLQGLQHMLRWYAHQQLS